MEIWGDRISGNCLKVQWIADRLGLQHRWIDVDILAGDTRSPAFLAMNPAGQVPLVRWPDGRTLAQSNAILLHLAEGSALIPADAFTRAKMLEWLFWEQYSHEPAVAVARFRVLYQGQSPDDLDPALLAKCAAALTRLEAGVADGFLVGRRLSLADVALVAYTRMAGDAGLSLDPFPAIRRWIGLVEAELGLPPYR
ncbi:glutathione S-transferase [Sphingomonas jatrophae]|uniref:Glutathione S-transferase n=1 Tax=Sphingomonas jatrophae TaxID=1166337 RepID=A0A1I6K0X1_9SPHN|nr:glutathione S-transferase [Sphingomonas jatrophae]